MLVDPLALTFAISAMQGAGPTLLRATTNKGAGQLSCSHAIKATSPNYHRHQGTKGEAITLTSTPISQQMSGGGPALQCSYSWGSLIYKPSTRASPTVPPRQGVLYSLGRGAGPVLQVVQLVRGRDSSPGLMTPGAAFLTMGGGGRGHHLCIHATP